MDPFSIRSSVFQVKCCISRIVLPSKAASKFRATTTLTEMRMDKDNRNATKTLSRSIKTWDLEALNEVQWKNS